MVARRIVAALPAVPLAGVAVIVGQILYAAHRPGLPSLDNQDPSGRVGASHLPELRMVVLGDSSVTAPGVAPIDDAWVRRVARFLADRFHIDLRSVAVGGAKARDVIASQMEPALAMQPDMALLSVGANDAIRLTPVARFEEEMHEIVRTLHDAVPAVAVGGIGDLGSIPRLPALAGTLARMRARVFDDVVTRVVAHYDRAGKASAWGELWEPFSSGDPAVYGADRFHASGMGHAIFAESFIPVVEELLAHLDE